MTGCAPTSRVGVLGITARHPSVKWISHVRDRIVGNYFLYLPGAVMLTKSPTVIENVRLDKGTVRFRISAAPPISCSGFQVEPLRQIVVLDLATGKVLPGPNRSEQWVFQRPAEHQEMFSVGSETFIARSACPADTRLLVARTMYGQPVGDGELWLSQAGTRGVFVTSGNYVICVDLAELSLPECDHSDRVRDVRKGDVEGSVRLEELIP